MCDQNILAEKSNSGNWRLYALYSPVSVVDIGSYVVSSLDAGDINDSKDVKQ